MIRYLRQPAGLINVSTASNITSTVLGTTLTVTNQTPSTSISTGALLVAGGLGVAGNINATAIHGTLSTANQPNITQIGVLPALNATNTCASRSGGTAQNP